jgi:hypothetical protein
VTKKVVTMGNSRWDAREITAANFEEALLAGQGEVLDAAAAQAAELARVEALAPRPGLDWPGAPEEVARGEILAAFASAGATAEQLWQVMRELDVMGAELWTAVAYETGTLPLRWE